MAAKQNACIIKCEKKIMIKSDKGEKDSKWESCKYMSFLLHVVSNLLRAQRLEKKFLNNNWLKSMVERDLKKWFSTTAAL
jgi:hypothetical protein